MLLRQYFMSLKVLDRWTHLGPHMSKHWDKVATNVAKSHPCIPPKKPTPASSPVATTNKRPSNTTAASGKTSWDHWTPAKIRARRSSVGPLTERDTEVDRDSPPPPPPLTPVQSLSDIPEDDEKELSIMRKFSRKWCAKAGVHTKAGDALEEDEVDCDWTKAIAPKVEGRIIMIGAKS